MKRFLFIQDFIKLISQGKTFRKICAIILRVAAVVTIIGALIAWLYIWKLVFSSATMGWVIGGIVAQLLAAVLVYMVVHLLLLRATNLEKLPESQYNVISTVSVLLKLNGEILASLVAFVGVAGGLFIWIAGRGLTDLLGFIPYLSPSYNVTFLGGLTAIILGVLGAFGILVAFYFLAEMVNVLVDIAKNTAKK